MDLGLARVVECLSVDGLERLDLLLDGLVMMVSLGLFTSWNGMVVTRRSTLLTYITSA